MNIENITREFKKTEIASQCALIIYTDYSALWSCLRQHFRGPSDLMDQIVQLGNDHMEQGKYCDERKVLIAQLQFQIGPLRSIQRVKDDCL